MEGKTEPIIKAAAAVQLPRLNDPLQLDQQQRRHWYRTLSHFQAASHKPIYCLDCEMVSAREQRRVKNVCGRVSVVDEGGNVVLDTYVLPRGRIVNYHTQWSGIEKHHMEDAIPFDQVQSTLNEMLRNSRLIGHAIFNDLKCLELDRRKLNADINDTCSSVMLRHLAGFDLKNQASLKRLTKRVYNETIQTGHHCSKVDALSTLRLYRKEVEVWESLGAGVVESRPPTKRKKRLLQALEELQEG
jgi:RNA exonuclease 4